MNHEKCSSVDIDANSSDELLFSGNNGVYAENVGELKDMFDFPK